MLKRPTPRAFTFIELLIVLAVLATLAALLLPALMAVRARGRETDCRTKLHQLGLALRMYADDHNGGWPRGVYWDRQLLAYLHVPPPYTCPDVKHWSYVPGYAAAAPPGYLTTGYAFNSFLLGPPEAPERPFYADNLAAVPFPTIRPGGTRLLSVRRELARPARRRRMLRS